jgi:hypothetical protein
MLPCKFMKPHTVGASIVLTLVPANMFIRHWALFGVSIVPRVRPFLPRPISPVA